MYKEHISRIHAAGHPDGFSAQWAGTPDGAVSPANSLPPAPARSKTRRRRVPSRPVPRASHRTSNEHFDGVGSILSYLVFPNCNERPPSRPQAPFSVHIALTIVRQLRSPPCRVLLRLRSMQWTTVPEAPVYLDDYPLSRKHDVMLAAPVYDREMRPVPETPPVEFSTERKLGSRVLLLLPMHAGKSGLRRCCGTTRPPRGLRGLRVRLGR